MIKTILTIDVDAFFAQVEENKNPFYKNKPIAIGKDLNGHGVITTSNYVARKFNVYSGQPIFKAKENCKNLIIIDPDFDEYIKVSEKIFKLINSFSNEIEISSIDECFIDITKLISNIKTPLFWAQKIQREIYEKLNITVSIGISNQKSLAKLASSVKKPKGIYTIFKSEIKEKLWPRMLEDFPGIGVQTKRKLNNFDFYTIKDLAVINKNDTRYDFLSKDLGKNFEKLLSEIRGEGEDELNKEIKDLKSISAHKTFENPILKQEQLIFELKKLTEKVVFKLKYRNLKTNTVSLLNKNVGKIQKVKFKKNEVLIRKIISKQIKLSEYTNDFEMIFSAILNLFDSWYESNFKIRFIGLSVANLLDVNKIKTQLKIDDLINVKLSSKKIKIEIKKSKIENLKDEINNHFEKKIIGTGIDFKTKKAFIDKSFSQRDEIRFKNWGK